MAVADQTPYSGPISIFTKNSDIYLAVAVVGILVFMIMPLPTIVLDLLLSLNITASLTILLASMYIMKPLELSSFPSILLLATLFRLALNVASTRLILLHGNESTAAAGKVIMAFGSFVVGGNFLVGIIVFLILVAINYMVITKGAGRIAEVAARFTLDAMPGKQMSIDADLNAGIIDEQEARIRRDVIAREAEYYGSMDGANKFVRGDAIAGIVITLINIVGGLAIGVFQNKMSFGQAAQNYTLLTIGDGLVTQVPALIISTAAGIIVTRAGNDSSLGKEISSQILVQPRAIAITAAVLFGFALVPGLPTIPFMILAVFSGGLAYMIYQASTEAMRVKEEQKLQEEQMVPLEKFDTLPPLDTLAIEIGYGLIPLVDVEQDGQLLDRIKTIRMQVAYDIGIMVAPIHIQDNMQLKPGEYRILLKGNEVARGELMANYYLAMNPGTAEEDIDGIPTQEPTYGLPASWIKENVKEDAIAKGYTVVDLATVMITHLSEMIRRHSHELLGRQEVQQLLDSVKETHPKVVEELIPNLLPLGGVVRVLQNLLKEQVPIRDLLSILETLSDWAPLTKDLDVLTEKVRQSLARTITKLHLSPEGVIPAVTLSPAIESAISEAIQNSDHGGMLALDPVLAQKIIHNVAGQLEKITASNYPALVMCSAQIRPHLKKLIERFLPNVNVISYDEILNTAEIKPLATVELSDAD